MGLPAAGPASRTVLLAFALLAAGSASAQGSEMRLEKASSPAAADCFDQIRKLPPPVFDPRNGLTAGVDRPAAPGTVVVRLTFTSAGSPPAVEIVYEPGEPRLVAVVRRALEDYRLSCMPAGNEQLVATRQFVFEGHDAAPRPRLKPGLALLDIIRLVKDIQSQRVRFDFSTMNCPFQVEFAPFRPYMANGVREVGAHHPARDEFLAWLSNITLDLPPSFMRTAVGQQSTISVPCTLMDLT